MRASAAASSRLLEHPRLPHLLLGFYLLLWTILAVRPASRQDWLLENLPVFAGVPILIATYRRFQFSGLSYLTITIFLILHAFGAHYTYTEMPLGNWVRDALGLSRNHYDRFVHLAFGLLMAGPVRQFVREGLGVRPAWSALASAQTVAAWSAAYEVLEAIVALLASPELGAAYNGIQGDVWDAQKDMALAVGGAVAALAAGGLVRRWRREPKN